MVNKVFSRRVDFDANFDYSRRVDWRSKKENRKRGVDWSYSEPEWSQPEDKLKHTRESESKYCVANECLKGNSAERWFKNNEEQTVLIDAKKEEI